MSGFITYKSYSFKNKDPIIDKLRTMIADEKLTYQEIHDGSGVAVSTLSNWFSGDTRRPQFASIMAVTRFAGYDLELVKRKGARVIHMRKAS